MNDRVEGNPLFVPNRRRRRRGNCRSAPILRFLCVAASAVLVTTIIDNAILGKVLVASFSVDPMSSPTATKNSGNGPSESPVILVIGSCGLDRLLGVSSYPVADSKIRTTSYAEVGGGNAANTASAIGKLVDAKVFCSSSSSGEQIRVQLLSKVGDDVLGQTIIDELTESNVETSSLLFHRGDPGSTTAFTTVIVDEKEQTRTCIHTPGTCGELSLEDVESLSKDDVDEVFRNVIHLHSDARHTDVSLWMAKEAKIRGITVSCDCEKDRSTKALDELIGVCDILFTNSNYLGDYLQRLTGEREAATGRQPLAKQKVFGRYENEQEATKEELLDIYARSLTPSMYFSRWQQELAIGKEVVVTHGSIGALHFKQTKSSKKSRNDVSSNSVNDIEVVLEAPEEIVVKHTFDDGKDTFENIYQVHQVGILNDAPVMDTTGAGDAFIGGYILMSNMVFGEDDDKAIGNNVQIALQTGSFVGGRKVGGPGARTALPTGKDFDVLGSSVADAKASLQNLLRSFNNSQN